MTYAEFKRTVDYENAIFVEVFGNNDIEFHPEVPEEWLEKQRVGYWTMDGDVAHVVLQVPAMGGDNNPIPEFSCAQVGHRIEIEEAVETLFNTILSPDEVRVADEYIFHEAALAVAKILDSYGYDVRYPHRVWDEDGFARITESIRELEPEPKEDLQMP